MKINVKFNLQRKNVKKCPILASVTWEGNRLQLSTGISIETRFWSNPRQNVLPGCSNAIELNRFLDKIRISLTDFYYYEKTAGNFVTHEAMKRKFRMILNPEKFVTNKKQADLPLRVLLKNYVDEKEKCGLYSAKTIENWKTYKNHYINYEKARNKTLFMSDMNYQFSEDFTLYLIKDKNLVDTYALKILKSFQTFLKDCFDRGLSNNSSYAREFAKTLKKYKSNNNKEILVLTVKEIDKIWACEPKSDNLRKTKDLFLLQIHIGVRISDLMSLSPEKFDMEQKIIKVFTQKTKETVIIPISKPVEKILQKYPSLKFPKYDKNQYNTNIKELCKLAGIDTPCEKIKYRMRKAVKEVKPKYKFMSSHVARRTFVTVSLIKGVIREKLRKISGHKSIEAFERYVNITQEEAVDAVRDAWDNDFDAND